MAMNNWKPIALGICVLASSGLIGLAQVTNAPAQAPVMAKKPVAIVFFGLYTQCYKFDKALSGYELKMANAHGDRVQNFPSVKDLFKADLVILSDVSGKEFTEGQIKQIRSYVEDGGGLLVMGGPFTYGEGCFKEQGIEDLLPVEGAAFDLKWEKAGQALAKAKEHAVMAGVDFGGKPMVYWVHKVKVKSGGEVLVKAGEYAVLVAGRCGKGKVLAFMGTPMGSGGAGQVPFWEWGGWGPWVGNMAKWLGTREEATATMPALNKTEVKP
jgi:uncharacterized membrane protein